MSTDCSRELNEGHVQLAWNLSSRLGEADLAFGELLPEKPEWMEQEEYEERNSVGFQVERLTSGSAS